MTVHSVDNLNRMWPIFDRRKRYILHRLVFFLAKPPPQVRRIRRTNDFTTLVPLTAMAFADVGCTNTISQYCTEDLQKNSPVVS